MITSALAYLRHRHRHDLVKREDAATLAVARYAAENAKLTKQLEQLQGKHSDLVFWSFWHCPDKRAHRNALEGLQAVRWAHRSALLKMADLERRVKKNTTKKQRRKWGIRV